MAALAEARRRGGRGGGEGTCGGEGTLGDKAASAPAANRADDCADADADADAVRCVPLGWLRLHRPLLSVRAP